jgi:murein DD-endopeptidase MepM/ murein hydrolase activator NlpD
MRSENAFYTLIIAPTTSSRFYKIVIHYKHLYAVILVTLTSIGLLAGAGVWVVKNVATLIRFRRVQQENQTLKEHYRSLQSRVATLEAESAQLREMAKALGLNLDDTLPRGKQSAGAGGPVEIHFFAREVERVESELKRLRRHLEQEAVRLATTPTGWPVKGPTTDRFGVRRNPFGEGYEFHSGLDLSAGHGESVRATADGVVVYAAYRYDYGNLVVVDHGNGITTFYGHLSAIRVRVGEPVRRGTVVGLAGSTGRSTGSHVHYEIRVDDRPVNPLMFSGSP